ncbi:hypothetical protein D3C86_1936600 [compost metagenome]
MPGLIGKPGFGLIIHQPLETLHLIRLQRCHHQPGIATPIQTMGITQTGLLRVQMIDWCEAAVFQHHRFAHRQHRGAQQ